MGVFSREPQGTNRAARRQAAASIRRTLPSPSVTLSSIINSSGFAQAPAYTAPRGLTAAATQIRLNDKGEAEHFRSRRLAGANAWQAEAWEYYDAIGEIKYAFNLVA